MAFGIDDALMAATAGITLADTIVQTVKRYQQANVNIDLEVLLEEVKATTLKGINDADLALSQFERMLLERGVNIDRRLSDVIAETGSFSWIEQYRLGQIRKQFNAFTDSTYSAGDSIAALARCCNQTKEMGVSVVESAKAKHELQFQLLNALSLKEAIDLIRGQLLKYKAILADSAPPPRPVDPVSA
jgi:hypothetical protein